MKRQLFVLETLKTLRIFCRRYGLSEFSGKCVQLAESRFAASLLGLRFYSTYKTLFPLTVCLKLGPILIWFRRAWERGALFYLSFRNGIFGVQFSLTRDCPTAPIIMHFSLDTQNGRLWRWRYPLRQGTVHVIFRVGFKRPIQIFHRAWANLWAGNFDIEICRGNRRLVVYDEWDLAEIFHTYN